MIKKIAKHITTYILAISATATIVCCADTDFTNITNGNLLLSISGEINQVAVTRASDSGFADGDCMGIYVVDYEATAPGTLLANGNRATNVRHTFDEEQQTWVAAHDIYWRDEHTHADIYGYYPYADSTPSDVNNHAFVLKSDQAKASDRNAMGGYEASDFLWGKAENVAPTSSTVRLSLSHIMASARIILAEGTGFGNGEWEQTEKHIVVTNTRRECSIDLSSGTVSTTGKIESSATIPAQHGDEWRAIVLPQTVAAGTTMFAITVGGIPYKFSKSSDFTFLQGKLSNFTIIVDKIQETGKYKLTLKSESITEWENDLICHDATAKEYFVVHSTPGGLSNAIHKSGMKAQTIRNMKVTGLIDYRDFYFMRDSMDMLAALNLKQVRIKGADILDGDFLEYKDDQIPHGSFMHKNSLCSVMLPDTLVSIGYEAFHTCYNLTGSLIIPEGVVDIQRAAYHECYNLNGRLSLPSTLRKIGNDDNNTSHDLLDGLDYYNGVFQGCTQLTGELIIPDGVELIRGFCFNECKGFDGILHLPEKLKYLGANAFSGCNGLKGSLKIPEGVTNIPSAAFWDCGFDGTLHLHDGIATIESMAFRGNHFKGELVLPKSLQTIANEAFWGNNFSGSLHLPNTVMSLGDYAFAENERITGTLELPHDLVSVGEHAFEGCRSLEGLIIPESVENIRRDAFRDCFGINSIICKGAIPPTLGEGTMDGVSKENFTIEVPEPALAQYRTAPKWREFKRIAAHHELVCRPAIACALSTEHKQSLTIDAEGDWEVESKPSWCEVSPSSGSKKTQVTLTIKAMNSASGERDGKVVFRLKDKDYTHACHVQQRGYQYAEDELLMLQKATRGQRGGINIVIMGDGYNAEDIASGAYLNDMKSQIERFFDIEPYTSYRQYFNVYTAFPLSTERGIGTVNTITYNRFNTTFTGGAGMRADYDEIFNYVLSAPTITRDNLAETLIIIIPNSIEYDGRTQLWDDGRTISFCPISADEYPYDARGIIQHEAGGHGFGKLADEGIYHNTFIDACGCGCCGHIDDIRHGKSLGWYDNISLTNKTYNVPWQHLITDSRYSSMVDIFEGGFMHSRGVFRSEQTSCMNNNINYFNTISRESIVRRIKRYAGEEFSFEDFAAHDILKGTKAKR